MLSIDAGGIAHMSYNYQPTQQTLETPGNGFASRGKGQHIRRIQVPTPHEPYSVAPVPTPRSSNRAQLLAGLRTAPKTPTSASLLDSNGMGINVDHARPMDGSSAFLQPPRTALGLGYSQTNRSVNGHHHGPNHLSNSPPKMDHGRIAMVQNMKANIPTPPSSSPSGSISSDAEYEASVYAGLVAQNLHLAQQQQMLQQRLRNVQAQSLQRQFQHMQLQSTSQYGTPPISPAYIPNNAAVYSCATYNNPSNDMYGHQNIQSPSFMHNMSLPLNEFEAQAAANPEDELSASGRSKSRSPPAGFNSSRMSPPLKDKARPEKPLKRGHKKCSSLSSCVNAQTLALTDSGPKTSVPKLNSTMPPPTPSQSTFGGRGDHPLRQPRGPPSLEEIVSKPTSKHEGSKNFATRQRRRALTKLVNAGIERRVGRSTGSGGSMASVSENEVNFVVEDTESLPSRNGRHSSQGLRPDERDNSLSRQQSGSLGSTPLLVLSAAEKRKSALF